MTYQSAKIEVSSFNRFTDILVSAAAATTPI